MMEAIDFTLDERQLDELFLMLDTQKDDSLTKTEFRAIVFNKQIDPTTAFKKLRRLCLKSNFDLESEFKRKDDRQTGQISFFTYNRLMKGFVTQLHPFELELMFRHLDQKDTKVLNYKDFVDKVQEITFDIQPIKEDINELIKSYQITE
jgi:Ca2+-binding EF-hand superfamily protein